MIDKCNSEIDRYQFVDLLEWLVGVSDYSIDYTINDNCVYLVHMEDARIFLMFLFDKKTHYCYRFDSAYINEIGDEYAPNFIFDIYNLIKKG